MPSNPISPPSRHRIARLLGRRALAVGDPPEVVAPTPLATIANGYSIDDGGIDRYQSKVFVLPVNNLTNVRAQLRMNGLKPLIAGSLLTARAARLKRGCVVLAPTRARLLPRGVRIVSHTAGPDLIATEVDRAELDRLWECAQQTEPKQPLAPVVERDTAPLPYSGFATEVMNLMDAIRERARQQEAQVLADEARVITVIIEGPSGTGKESIARLFCREYWNVTASDRRQHVAESAAEWPDTLAASSVVGVRKGGFTDAEPNSGPFEEAAVFGTIHLDEVGKKPEAQPPLLRLISSGRYRPVGGKQEKMGPCLLVITSATGQDGTLPLYADLYSRAAGLLLVLLPLSGLIDEDFDALIDSLADLNGVAYVSDAARRGLREYKNDDLRSLGGAIRTAAENSRRRFPTQKRLLIIDNDLPLRRGRSPQTDQSIVDDEAIKLVRQAVETAQEDLPYIKIWLQDSRKETDLHDLGRTLEAAWKTRSNAGRFQDATPNLKAAIELFCVLSRAKLRVHKISELFGQKSPTWAKTKRDDWFPQGKGYPPPPGSRPYKANRKA
jgi:hypothetical protein